MARHRQIVELLRRRPIRSQLELADLLAADGIAVTQATLSRDLVELGAVKVRHARGGLQVPGLHRALPQVHGTDNRRQFGQ